MESMAAAAQTSSPPWVARRWFTPSGALVAEAAAGLAPTDVFARLGRLPHAIFLDSAATDAAESAADGGVRQARRPAATCYPRFFCIR